jgi:hypothetical protein
MKDSFSTLFATLSFILSLFTLWITQFRHGELRMTQPTLLCLKREQPLGTPKIFLRTLLHTTASKGRVIETMFLRVQQPSGTYVFDFWGHTDAGKLTLGSGLFVGQTGVASDHHFNPRRDAEHFIFTDGQYRIEVFAVTVGRSKPKRLKEMSFYVDGQQAAELIQITDLELFLFWNASTHSYEARLDRPPRRAPALG